MNKFVEVSKTFGLGVLAGFAVCLGVFSYLLICSNFSGDMEGFGKIFGSFAFTIGLLFICFLSLKLYTGKIGFILDYKKGSALDLAIIILGNAVGSIIAGYIFYVISPDSLKSFALAFVDKKNLDLNWINFCKIFISSCIGGMIVFLSVFFFTKANSIGLKIIGIIFPIFIFAICGFDHVVANLFYFSFNQIWSTKALKAFVYIIICLLGNSIGSILLYGSFKLLGVKFYGEKN